MSFFAGLAIGAPLASAQANGQTAETAEQTPTQSKVAGIALLELESVPLDQPPALSWLFGNTNLPTTRQVLDEIERVSRSDDLQGMVIRLRGVSLPLAKAEEIGKALEALRAKGKKVHLFADGYETGEFYLGSFCDDLIVQSGGGVSLPGMYMEEMYLADTMSWVGLTPQFVQVGDYKGANETMTRSAPSPQWEQNINGLLDGIYGNVRSRIKSARQLDDAALDNVMKQAWMTTGENAKRLGLVDTVIDLPELPAHLEQTYSVQEVAWTNVLEKRSRAGIDLSNPFALLSKMTREPEVKVKKDSIAVVHIDGAIVDGQSSSGGMFGGSNVGSHTIRVALDQIESEDLIKGVILRIDSPGGSAIASEVIWQGVKRVSQSKPVWVSVGSMAASGGYYIAVAGDRIFVNPSSIVGSIGVVGGKIAMGGLYDKAKINVVGRARGPLGDMLSSAKPWTPQQQDFVREKMQETYDLFTARVSAGRKNIDLSKTAEGRLFTGNTAVTLNMADVVGGMEDAIEQLASSLSLESGEFDVLNFPAPKPFAEVMAEFMGGMASSPLSALSANQHAVGPAGLLAVDAIRTLVGERAWPGVRANLQSLMQLRSEPVLLTSPRAIIFR